MISSRERERTSERERERGRDTVRYIRKMDGHKDMFVECERKRQRGIGASEKSGKVRERKSER